MREDALEVDILVVDEPGALGHAHRAEGPRADERDLAAQQVGADVELHVAAFADVAGGAPGLHASHCGLARRRGAAAFEGEVDAFALCLFTNALQNVFARSVDDPICTEVLGQLHPLGTRLDGDDSQAHRCAEQRRAQEEAGIGLAQPEADQVEHEDDRQPAIGEESHAARGEQPASVAVQRAQRKGILFLSTPFSREAADFLETIGVPAFKTGSGELTHLPMQQHGPAPVQVPLTRHEYRR